jgi:hypothetical protein
MLSSPNSAPGAAPLIFDICSFQLVVRAFGWRKRRLDLAVITLFGVTRHALYAIVLGSERKEI